MKRCAMIVLLLLISGTALGECVHDGPGVAREETCDCSHRPYRLFWAEKYRDGGTVRIVVADSVGCAVFITQDWRIGSETQGRIFVRPLAPGSDGARLVAFENEDEIAGMLNRVVGKLLTRTEHREWPNGGCPERLSADQCRQIGWITDVLRRMSHR